MYVSPKRQMLLYSTTTELKVANTLVSSHTCEFLTNPKSKSKVKVQAEDWVFIKNRFSNHPVGRISNKF